MVRFLGYLMSTLGKKPRVAIVGFGLVGRVAALELIEHYDITVYERDRQDAQTGAGTLAAAMLAPLAESVICSQAIAQQGLDAIKMWPRLLAKLDDAVFFQQAGSLIVAHQQDRGDLQSFAQRLKPLDGHSPYPVDQRMSADL